MLITGATLAVLSIVYPVVNTIMLIVTVCVAAIALVTFLVMLFREPPGTRATSDGSQ
ncbi:hypothetical protein [Kibdelosporangium aridum]|uniref:hypothetical protein n=1 Tax=Kibdelosporangium aridum TaxID=2030 RepID=UPI000AF607B4|nr:hypothetical protein [Kibdelosporangium aridum]